MPGPLLTIGAGVSCPHAAPATGAPGFPRVTLSGMPASIVSDLWTVVGCPFQVPIGTGTKPQPCIKVQWTAPATRVLINGVPALLGTSAGIGQSVEQIPQGPAIVSTVQPRVTGI
ncbi:hypothetical protein [Ruegeria hyattellae]|uniref:hypothetical protein n=1 Tax=Ruegeria hyattellae TaxID=3233337 RepID=UPI00355B7640